MKLLQVFSITILLFGSLAMGQPHNVQYRAFFGANNLHCEFFVNDLPYQSTYNITHAPEQLSFMGNVGTVFAEGKNTITIQAIALEKPKEGFGEAYCEMAVLASTLDPETEEDSSKLVAMIRIVQNKEGELIMSEGEPLEGKRVASIPTLKLLDQKSGGDTPYNDVLVTQEIMVYHEHNHHYSWTRAEPFANNPANREALWQVYNAYREAFARKDIETLKELMEPGMSETEAYKGDPETGRYARSVLNIFHKAWAAPDFKVLPIKREDYVLQLSAGGRLFRFVKKSSIFDSPVIYQKNGGTSILSPNFTRVNGRIGEAFQ